MKQIRESGLNVDFEIRFHPFMLDSSLPQSPGYNKRAWYASRLGASRIKAAEEQMVVLGLSEGLRLKCVAFASICSDAERERCYSYDGQVSNTLDSHRLIAKAREIGGQNAQLRVVEGLWNAYLERADDIGDRNVLAAEMDDIGVMSKTEVCIEYFYGLMVD